MRVAVVVGEAGSVSPYKGAAWGEVLAHTAQRLQWTNLEFEMLVWEGSEVVAGG